MPRLQSFLICLLLVCSLGVITGRAERMKLLTPQTGWALLGPGLMWTTDGGHTWTKITPPLPKGEHITSIFFLNTQDGWALLSGPQKDSEAPRFDLAITANSGETWSENPVTVPGLNPRSFLLDGGGYIYFSDSLHGWMNLSLVSSAAVRGAILIATLDGGRTWRWVASPGGYGPIYFADANLGWLSGGPANQLYVTRDGADTWHDVTLQPPPQAGQAIYPTYGLPEFENGEDGFLPVTFSGTEGVHSVLVMFQTNDRGRTWKPEAVVPTLAQTSLGEVLPASIADSTLITANVSDQVLTLTKATRRGEASATARIKLLRSAVMALSFADSVDGWALLGYNGPMARLYSTSDGGNTWTDITPRVTKKPLPRGRVLRIPRLPGPPTGLSLPSATPGSTPSHPSTTGPQARK